MRHKILIGWAIAFISILFLGIVVSFPLGIPIVLSIMIPIEIGVALAAVPLSIIDFIIEHEVKLGQKKKSGRDQYRELEEKAEIKYNEFNDKDEDFEYIELDDEDNIGDILVLEDIIVDDFDDDIKILIGDVEIIDISDKTSIEIVKDNFSNEEILRIFHEKESLLEIIKILKKFELHSFSQEFYEKMNEIRWSEKDQSDFIEDMMCFTPNERLVILNKMIMLSKALN